MSTETQKLPFKLPTPGSERGTWVQTERKAHEAWSRLVMHNGRAAALLHLLVARMGEKNAVVISRSTLASLMGCSEATIKRATRDLKVDNWIQTISLGGKGGVNAFVVNKQVAWQQDRSQMHLAVFDATIVASLEEQGEEANVSSSDLRSIPKMYPGELQLPTGEGEDPPSQPLLAGLEPDLPAINATVQEPPPVHAPASEVQPTSMAASKAQWKIIFPQGFIEMNRLGWSTAAPLPDGGETPDGKKS